MLEDGKRGSVPSCEAVAEIPHADASPHSVSSDKEVRHCHQPDAQLIEGCLKGDRDAWAALLERYSALIYSIAWKSKLPPEDVADVFQSVALALLEDLGELRDGTKLSSWLTQVAIHECMRIKRRHSRALKSLDEVSEELAGIPDESLLPDEMVQRLEEQQLVRQALTMMDEPCRRLLTQLFFDKEMWSYEAIAKELGLSVSTIGPKRTRCLRKLLQILTELGI
ncbi:MAG: sigma-70 family RNA polymerase sigma factor [Acidobacteria bacterium]|nr:sigma-70 family RNA polymerase sigma factor [Acidobacteriota bacterium]